MEKKRKITKMHIKYISLVKSPANMEQLILKNTDFKPDFSHYVQLEKKDSKKHIAYGIVYAPDVADAQGDFADADTIREAAYEFMKNAYNSNVDTFHNFMPASAFIAENWIVKENDALFPQKKDAWAVGIKIEDPALWLKCENGEINGISMAGIGNALMLHKSSIPYKKLPLAPPETQWNFDETKTDAKTLALICAYVDTDNYNPDENGLYPKAAYKLPHHETKPPYRTVLKGVQAAGNSIQGARGGVNIPGKYLPGVKKHLEEHYHEFGEKAPWEVEKSIISKFIEIFKKEEKTMDEKMKQEIIELIKNTVKEAPGKENKRGENTDIEELRKEVENLKKEKQEAEKAAILKSNIADLESKIETIKKAKEKGETDKAVDESLAIFEKELETLKKNKDENKEDLKKEVLELKKEIEQIKKNALNSQQGKETEEKNDDDWNHEIL